MIIRRWAADKTLISSNHQGRVGEIWLSEIIRLFNCESIITIEFKFNYCCRRVHSSY